MNPEDMEDLKDDLKDLKQAKMAVGLVLILLRRLGLGSAVGAALKRYLKPEAAVGGILGLSLLKFRPDLLPGFTEISSVTTGMVLGALVGQSIRWIAQGIKPLRFYGRLLEARVLHSLGEIPAHLFKEIRDTTVRRYFLDDKPVPGTAAQQSPTNPQAVFPPQQVVAQTQPQVAQLPQGNISPP